MRKLFPLVFIISLIICCGAASEVDQAMVSDRIARNAWIDIIEDNGHEGSCSGVILETGKVLTAKHCLGKTLKVNKEPATVFKVGDGDLMILKCKTPIFPPLEIADVKAGDHVWSVFNEGDFINLYDAGTVMKVEDKRILVKITGAPGFSGSGMYDEAGRLVGIGNQFSAAMFGNSIVGFHATIIFSIAVNADEIRKFLAK